MYLEVSGSGLDCYLHDCETKNGHELVYSIDGDLHRQTATLT